MNCCDTPDVFTDGGSYRVCDYWTIGVCVRCGQIVYTSPLGSCEPLKDHDLLWLLQCRPEWMKNLTMDQRTIRRCITKIRPPREFVLRVRPELIPV